MNRRNLADLRDGLEFDVIHAPLTDLLSDKIQDRPDIFDIALMKGVALKLSYTKTLQRLISDHRPVLMRVGPISDNRPRDEKIITKVSLTLEEIDTPTLNKIINSIESTYDIDIATGALTSHITTVVGNSSRKVPANSDCQELPADVCNLIRAKNAALRCASAYPTLSNRRVLQCGVSARVKETRNENWSAFIEEIHPTHKAYWKVPNFTLEKYHPFRDQI